MVAGANEEVCQGFWPADIDLHLSPTFQLGEVLRNFPSAHIVTI